MTCPSCGGSGDDPVAVTLWRSDYPPVLTIWCWNHKHRVGKVFHMHGQRVICLPASRFLAQAFEHGSKDHGANVACLHAVMDEVEQMSEQEWVRCDCGAGQIDRHRVLLYLDTFRAPEMLAGPMKVGEPARREARRHD